MSMTVKDKRKQIRREELREKFKAVEYINQLNKLSTQYTEVIKEINDIYKTREELRGKAKLTAKDKAMLSVTNSLMTVLKMKMLALEKSADINFRRLRFVLPELKAIEFDDGNGNNPFAAFAQAVTSMNESK